jgi:predicted mannosyl-3-phosphoglycerate phosphatase (HAD superfamily)
MKTVIDDAMKVLANTGIKCERVQTRAEYSAFLVARENNRKAYFLWRKMSQDDFQFMGAKFWVGNEPTEGSTEKNLIMAICKTQNL